MGPSPSKVGKYSIVGVLARGTSEDVYLAEYAGRRVAIRLFSSVAGPDKERLVEEARKIAGLSHANIAFQEVGVHEDQPFLVAEMSGTNLETWLGGDPSLADQLGVIEGLCAGISYAHEHGVIHRMLTTGSVLVTPDGEARIWNFGFAKLKPEKGVLAYVAPEILEGQPATQQSDIYSAGLVCYEILTGIAPKPGDSGVAKPVREVKSETPRDLSDAVMACRERAPDWRPKDLSYLLEVVRKLRGSSGPKTPRPVAAAAPVARAATPSLRGRSTEKGGPPIAVIAIGVGLLIGAAAFYFLRGNKPASPEPSATTTTVATTTLAAAPDTTLASTSTGPTATRPTAVPTTLAGRPTPTPPPVTTLAPAAATPKPTPPPATVAPATTLPPATTTLPPSTTMAAAVSATAPATQAHGVPVLRALSPPMLKRGQTMLVDVRGSDLYPQLVPTLLKAKGGVAPGLRVARQRFVNDTTIQVFIEVAADAAAGQYAIVLSDGGNSTNTLRIDVAK